MLRVLSSYRIGRVMEIEKMITKKEDLHFTYVINTPELREAFIDKCNEFGIGVCGFGGENYLEVYSSGCDEFEICGTDDLEPQSKELTLSDLKPRTKTEFVKVEYNHAWEIIKLYEDGVELFKTDSDELQIERINSIALRAQARYPFYRKVETEIDDRQEFIDECMLIGGLRARDGAGEVYGNLYDSGKFKLVEK